MYTLHREGEIWALAVDDAVIRLRDSVGLRYLEVLIGAPGREFHVLDLALEASDQGSRADVKAIAAMPAGAVLDPQAKAAYRSHLARLEESIEEAEAIGDGGRAARARDERDQIAAELARALGLGGRDRKIGGAAERARQSVRKAIQRAVSSIASHDEGLGHHLDEALRTGYFCCYSPAGEALLRPALEVAHVAGNLPEPRTELLGRGAELSALAPALEGTRLLTLTGPAGAGKTRLAIAVGARLASRKARSVWFADLSSAGDIPQIGAAIARALGVRSETDDAMHAPLEALRNARAMLILDNCEHLIGPLREIIPLILNSCPRVSVVATSREALGVDGERPWPVPPLALPTEGAPAGEIATSPAVALFVERARLADPGFSLSDPNAAWVSRICRAVEGIPLAIEIAAARMRALGPEQIATRIGDRSSLMTAAGEGEKRSTLESTLDWGFDLLSPAERVVFARLSVFVGGFSIDAAEEVCSGGEIDRGDMLRLVESLVSRSLVQKVDSAAGPRLRMLEMIRGYASQRLETSADPRYIKGRHLSWARSLAGELAPRMAAGLDQVAALDRFETEIGNVRAALAFAEARGDRAALLEIAGGLFRGWHRRGYIREGVERLRAGLDALTGEVAPEVMLRALIAGAHLARIAREPGSAARWYSRAESLAADLGDDAAAAEILQGLATLAEPSARREMFERSLALATSAGDELVAAYAQNRLVPTLARTDPRAGVLLSEAHGTLTRLGDIAGAVGVADLAGAVAFEAGRHDEAAEWFNRSIELSTRTGDRRWTVRSMCHLGLVRLTQERVAEAGAIFTDALSRAREIGALVWSAYALTGLGSVALAEGEAARARGYMLDGLAERRAMGDSVGVAFSEQALAGVARQAGDMTEMQGRYRASLSVVAEAGNTYGVLSALEPLALAVLRAGDPGRAALIFGGAEGISERTGVAMPEAALAETTRREIIEALGEEPAARAFREGAELGRDEVVALATDH